MRGIVAILSAVLLVVTGCGDDGPGAAEPASAPPTATTPAGTSARVGVEPEGIVYDATTRTVAVAVRDPDRLLLLDPATLAVRRSVRLPGHVRHLQLAGAGGPVLVPAESANEIVQVPLSSGAAEATKVRDQPHDAAATTDGTVAVGDEFGGSLSIVRGGRVVHTFTDLDQPGGVVALGGQRVAVVDVGAFTVTTYDLAAERRIARTSAGAGPTHGVALKDGRLLVADTRGDALLMYSTSPLAQPTRCRWRARRTASPSTRRRRRCG